MGRGDSLGELEQLILIAILRLGDQAYGAAIRKELEHRAGRLITGGSVYATLDRLEQKGYVTSKLGEPLAERGGRARTYFKIEAPEPQPEFQIGAGHFIGCGSRDQDTRCGWSWV